MSKEYVRQHPYTKLGEDAVKAVGDLSMALDSALEANQERCNTAHKALQARDESLADAKNLRERYAELQVKVNGSLATKAVNERNEALLRAEEAEKGKEGWQKRAEQAELQLAACGVAATGWAKGKDCKQGDYGWSASFADVLDLRDRFEKMDIERERAAKQDKVYKAHPEPATEMPLPTSGTARVVWKDNPETAECRLTVAEQVEGLRSKVAELERKLG